MPKKKASLSPPVAPPPATPLTMLLTSMEMQVPGEVRRKWDDLGVLVPAQKAFAWLESVGRLPVGMDFDQFLGAYQIILES